MTWGLLGGLALLALVDSTSFGTLVLPMLLLAQPQLRHAQLAVYVLTISAFYYLLGLVLLLAGDAVRARWDQWGAALESTPAYVVQVVIGAALVALSYAIDPKYAHVVGRFRRRRAAGEEGAGRQGRWRSRLLGESASLGLTASVALSAGLVEAASMLPYLAAIAMITTAGLPLAGSAAVLAGYVAVMTLPVLVLWGLRTVARDAVEPRLQRLSAWLAARSGSALAWTVGIVGVVLLLNGLPVVINRLS